MLFPCIRRSKLSCCTASVSQIIEAAEDTFFGNPQDPRQDGEIEGWIGLQGSTEEIAHKSDAVLIKTVSPSLLDRNIVFIQKKDDRLLIIALHHIHQAPQGFFHFDRRPLTVVDALAVFSFSS